MIKFILHFTYIFMFLTGHVLPAADSAFRADLYILNPASNSEFINTKSQQTLRLKDILNISGGAKTDQKVFAMVKVTIPEGYHIYSNDDPIAATKILLKNIKKSLVTYPIATIKHVDQEKLAIYRGAVYFFICFDNLENKSVESIETTFEATMCGNDTCFPIFKNLKAQVLSAKQFLEYMPDEKTLNNSFENVEEKPTWYVDLFFMFCFAILGGVLLNLMPCVLPVLSLKVLNLTKIKRRKTLRQSGVFFFLGVVSFFWLLVIIILLLKNAGMHVGWGFQLQHPGFISFLLILFVALSLNLFGLFEIPTFRMAAHASGYKAKDYRLSSFVHGAITTLVASPCSAPFMGAALGFALSQSVFATMLIFTGVGIGVSLPYLMFCFFPRSIVILPKQGQWMVYFKQSMGFAMLGSTIWLLSILYNQLNEIGFMCIIFSALVVSIALWLLGIMQFQQKKRIRITLLVLSLLILLFSAIISRYAILNNQTEVKAFEKYDNVEFWQVYSKNNVEDALANGKAVFIDFTATWCITCQANKKLVLNTKAFANLLADNNVVGLRADWTTHDQEITKALEFYGRNSVPTYVLIKPNGEHTVLPEILTLNKVKQKLRETQ